MSWKAWIFVVTVSSSFFHFSTGETGRIVLFLTLNFFDLRQVI